MADMALFVGWGDPVRGREARAVQVFGETMSYYQRLKDQGEIESYEAVLLQPHGGDLGGFVLLRGEQAKLLRIMESEEFENLSTRASLIVEHFGVVPALIGERLQRGMAQYQQQASELAA